MQRILALMLCLFVAFAALCGATQNTHPCCHDNSNCSQAVAQPMQSHRAVNTVDPVAVAAGAAVVATVLPAVSLEFAPVLPAPVSRSAPIFSLRM